MKKKNGKKQRRLSKLKFLMGLLIVITGGSLMIDLLGLSVMSYTTNVNEILLFPMAMLILIVGIGMVIKHSSVLEAKKK